MTVFQETSDLPQGTTTAPLIAAGDTILGRISGPSDRDWIAVDLIAGQTYSVAVVALGSTPLSDPYLRLMDPSLRPVAQNDDGLPNRNAILIFTATSTGRHYLEVSDYHLGRGDYGLTLANGAKPNFETDLVAGVIMDQSQIWQTPSQITYGFRIAGNDGATLFSAPFSTAQQTVVTAILAHFSEVANVTFSNKGMTNLATMLFANFSADNGIAAYAYLPGSANPFRVEGDVWNNLVYYDDAEPLYDSQFYETMLHEIGHAMGLTHPSRYDATLSTNITYQNAAQFIQDSESLTIMSYFGTDETGGSDLIADTLAIADILALQNAYGANMSTRAGDTTYGYNSGAGDIYDFTKNTTPKLTIWDGGGTDTLDLSGYGGAQRIDLNQGALSNVLGYFGNLGIAVGTVIERAIGGGGADTILGNDHDNSLFGGAGADRLFGGGGADRLFGDGGRDVLFGGAGDDVFYVDHPNDKIIEGIGGGYDIVQTTVSYTLAFGLSVQELRATGAGNIHLMGNEFANRLVAGAGANNLAGGGGADVFVFQTTSDAQGDQIIDFVTGLDKIDLSGIDANLGAGGDQSFGAMTTSALPNGLWWAASGSDVLIFGDVDGDASADFTIGLRTNSDIDSRDFIL